MSAIFQDLVFALRQLRLNPMFTAVAVLSLALGIGANTAIFQLIDAIRLRSIAVMNPQELAYIDFMKDSKRMGWWSTRSSNLVRSRMEKIFTALKSKLAMPGVCRRLRPELAYIPCAARM